MGVDLYSGLQSILEPRGPQAGHVDFLWWLFLVVSVIVWIAVAVALGLALWRRNRQAFAERPHGEPRKVRVVAAAAGLTVVVLFGLVVASVTASRSITTFPDPASRPIVVEVVGHQWWWDFRYIDEATGGSFRTSNELRIPVGRPVVVQVTSRDVIHSFWVPNLHGKIDLVPGRTNTIWFSADAPGEYRGQCAEFCGLQHAKMAFLVVAEGNDAFEAWAARQRAGVPRPDAVDLRRGEQVFLSTQCSLCHTVRGTGAWGMVGPDLSLIGSRRTLAAGTLRNTRGNLAGWILDPQRIKPGTHMPPTQLPSEDLHALLLYLESLR